MRRAAALLAAAQLAGCSWLFVEKPPGDAQPGEHVSCTEGRAAPVVDTILGAIYLVPGAAAAFVAEDPAERVAAMSTVAIGAVFLLSAWSGYTWTDRCRSLHDAYEESVGQEPSPATRPRPDARPDPRSDPAPGALNHACRLDGSCDEGLTCTRGRCLNVMK